MEVIELGNRRENGDELRNKYLLSSWPSFIEKFTESRNIKEVKICFLPTSEPLYTLHVGISKLTKECTVKYQSSDRVGAQGTWKGTRVFIKF